MLILPVVMMMTRKPVIGNLWFAETFAGGALAKEGGGWGDSTRLAEKRVPLAGTKCQRSRPLQNYLFRHLQHSMVQKTTNLDN